MAYRILTAVVIVLGAVAHVAAEPIRFLPPTDPTGRVFTINENDAWSGGRGLVFTAVRPVLLTSVSLFHDLTDIELSYQIARVAHTEGQVTDGQTILRQGTRTITTSGLEWIPFGVAPLELLAGSSYLLEFSFSGLGNQNFFHNNCEHFLPTAPNSCLGGQIRYSAGPFANIDGTAAGNTGNFVQPAVTVDVSPVPEPGTLFLLGSIAMTAALKGLRLRGGLSHTS